MIYPLLGLASADAAFIYVNKIKIPENFEKFLKSDSTTKVAVGGLAGDLADSSKPTNRQLILQSFLTLRDWCSSCHYCR
jgi:hypothetical protein